jgi:hypothetical protein
MGASFRRRHRVLKWVGCGLLAAIVALAIVASIVLHRAEPFVRARIVAALEDHFHARVELDSFHLSLVNGLWAEGKGLRIWPPARVAGVLVPGPAATVPADQPLIRLDSFRFHAPLRFAPGSPLHISVVELEGLTVQMPPRSRFEHGLAAEAKPSGAGMAALQFEVDTINCRNARLILETSKPGKLPLEFPISRLTLTHVSKGGAMDYDAELINPRPTGPIHATGSFGPWVVADPGQSAVTGAYQFDHADLSVFKGIAGILTSTGRYQGTLRNITVDGVTDTPDFRLTHFGNTLPLHTSFHATVDGTDGDTWLDPVDATLGSSHFTAQGQVVRVVVAPPGAPPHSIGHDIDLKVNVDRGRIEFFLRRPRRTQTPLLTGAVALKTGLHIPPGSKPIHERLNLSGHFTLQQVAFTSAKIQDRIEELSLRGQGRPKDVKTTAPDSIQSAMRGDFQMGAGVITLPNLVYTVPGAEIDLHGTYGVEGGALQFTGTARLAATVSQVVGGWKGVLLKSVDRYFQKDGAGTEVPIHIGGTRESPSFGVDLKKF